MIQLKGNVCWTFSIHVNWSITMKIDEFDKYCRFALTKKKKTVWTVFQNGTERKSNLFDVYVCMHQTIVLKPMSTAWMVLACVCVCATMVWCEQKSNSNGCAHSVTIFFCLSVVESVCAYFCVYITIHGLPSFIRSVYYFQSKGKTSNSGKPYNYYTRNVFILILFISSFDILNV